VKADFAHFIHTSIIDDIRYPTQFRNGEEWIFFSQLAKSHNLFAIDFDTVVKRYGADGLTDKRLGNQRKREMLEIRVAMLEGSVSDRILCKSKAQLAREFLLEGNTGGGFKMLKECFFLNPFEWRIYQYLIKWLLVRSKLLKIS
jgi:hypothetical protein